jgi:chromosome partitioning protein
MSDPTINSKTSLEILRKTYGDSVFSAVVPRNTDLRDAHFNKLDVFTFNAKSSSARAYSKLITELFEV